MRWVTVLMLAVMLTVCMASAQVSAETQKPQLGIDFLSGTSWHNNTRVNIGGHTILPDWETRPFEDYLYFSLRIRWGGHEIEWLHDKVYLGKDTADVKGFNMSDGFNHLLYNIPRKWGAFEGRLGFGVIIAHPEGTVNGKQIGYHGGPGWRLAGVGVQAAVTYRRPLWRGLSWLAEGKVTTAFAHLNYPHPVNDIEVPVTGYHLLMGLGYDF